MVKRILTLALITLAVVGCRAARVREGRWTMPPTVVVSTPGVVIEAADGSWRLSGDDAANAPFYSFDCVGRPTAENMRLGERIGGQRVVVHHPMHAQPLHGVLSLCRIHESVRGAVTEAYNIRIPPSYVEATSGGRTSVVFEPSGKTIYYADGEHDVPAWSLWLRRESL